MAVGVSGVGAGAEGGDGECLRVYERVVAMLPRVEALAAGRARLEAINALQHEFWEARDALLQQRLLQVEESRRRWEAAYIDLRRSGDDWSFAELQESDFEDLTAFVNVLDAENTEFQIKVKEVDAGAEHGQNAADHEHISRYLEAELRKLKLAYEALCSEKDKEVSSLTAQKDFVWDQLKTVKRDYAELLRYMENKSTRASEAAQELQKNVEQLQVASQKKDEEIRKLRARVKAVEAKRKLVPEGKLHKMDCMPVEKDGEIEKCKDRQPGTSENPKKATSETPRKGCSEGSALRRETNNDCSKQMLAEVGQPEASAKRTYLAFLPDDDEQNGNNCKTTNQVLEPLKRKRVSGKREVEQKGNKELAKGKTHDESNQSPDELAIYNALMYLRSLKDSFTDKPEKHAEFLAVQREFVGRRIDLDAFISTVKVLLDGQPELIRGFKSCFTCTPTQVFGSTNTKC